MQWCCIYYVLHMYCVFVCILHICNSTAYGRTFWRGIYFGGLAVLRAICQYFIRQKLHNVMSSLLQNHSLCTRPAAKRANLIFGMEESPLKAAYKDIATPKSFVYQRRTLGLSVNTRNAIQTTCTCTDHEI